MKSKLIHSFLIISLLIPSLGFGATKRHLDQLMRGYEFRDNFVGAMTGIMARVTEGFRQPLLPGDVAPEPDHKTHYIFGADLFTREFNPPAVTINSWNQEFLADVMKRWVTGNESARSVDLQVFLDMSQEAGELWSSMSTCMGGEESARASYGTGEFVCMDGKSSGRIAERISALHANVLDFIQTTDIQGTLEALQKAKQTPVIPMHPLLTQVFEEVFAIWFPFASTNGELRKWIKRNVKTAATTSKSERMINLLRLLTFDSVPAGLWPTPLALSHAYVLAKYAKLQENGTQVKSINDSINFAADFWYFDPTMLNPVYLLVQGVRAGFAIHESRKSIEPAAELIAQFRADQGGFIYEPEPGKKEIKSPYVLQARAVVQRLRDIAAIYGITEERLFR